MQNIIHIEKYDWDMINDLMTRFPDVGLSKIAKGYQLTKEEQIDEAFDLFSVSSKSVVNIAATFLNTYI
jgi:hypothetical protein